MGVPDNSHESKRSPLDGRVSSVSVDAAGWIAEPVAKQAWLDSLAERMTLNSFDLRLLATQRFGDVAVVLAESAQEGTHDGVPFSLTFRYTDVWVEGGSGWTLATRHASIVPAR
jgi:ketosteroid isomerase-like protein